MKQYYKVADHTFSVELPADCHLLDEMGQYAPFSVDAADSVVFSVKVVGKDVAAEKFPDLFKVEAASQVKEE